LEPRHWQSANIRFARRSQHRNNQRVIGNKLPHAKARDNCIVARPFREIDLGIPEYRGHLAAADTQPVKLTLQTVIGVRPPTVHYPHT
jgi:hypothetical protein